MSLRSSYVMGIERGSNNGPNIDDMGEPVVHISECSMTLTLSDEEAICLATDLLNQARKDDIVQIHIAAGLLTVRKEEP